jgi:hypothetical protein
MNEAILTIKFPRVQIRPRKIVHGRRAVLGALVQLHAVQIHDQSQALHDLRQTN